MKNLRGRSKTQPHVPEHNYIEKPVGGFNKVIQAFATYAHVSPKTLFYNVKVIEKMLAEKEENELQMQNV